MVLNLKNLKSEKIVKCLKIMLLLLLLYTIILLCHFFVFSDKLTYDELVAVTDIYEEMQTVNKDIKSDFYRENMLKVLDKQYILEELRKDSLLYALYVNDHAFSVFQTSKEAKTATNYLSRCDLNFSDFVNLEAAEGIIEISKSFFRRNIQTVEILALFTESMDDIIIPEQEYLAEVARVRSIKTLAVCISYFVLVIICYFTDFKKLKSIKVRSGK